MKTQKIGAFLIAAAMLAQSIPASATGAFNFATMVLPSVATVLQTGAANSENGAEVPADDGAGSNKVVAYEFLADDSRLNLTEGHLSSPILTENQVEKARELVGNNKKWSLKKFFSETGSHMVPMSSADGTNFLVGRSGNVLQLDTSVNLGGEKATALTQQGIKRVNEQGVVSLTFKEPTTKREEQQYYDVRDGSVARIRVNSSGEKPSLSSIQVQGSIEALNAALGTDDAKWVSEHPGISEFIEEYSEQLAKGGVFYLQSVGGGKNVQIYKYAPKQGDKPASWEEDNLLP